LVPSFGLEFNGKLYEFSDNSYTQFEISQLASGYITEDTKKYDEKVNQLSDYLRLLTNTSLKLDL
jgi:hypothetical protein